MDTYTTPDGRTFTAVGTTPYRRKSDGQMTELRVWTAPCAHPGCTGLRTVKTTLGADPARSTSFGSRHCPKHRVSRAEFLRRGREALSRMNAELCRRSAAKCRKLTDEDVAEIRRLRAEGHTYAALALVFPASPGTLREIANGRRRNPIA